MGAEIKEMYMSKPVKFKPSSKDRYYRRNVRRNSHLKVHFDDMCIAVLHAETVIH